MVKKILLIAAMLLVAAYLVAGFTVLNRAPKGQVCTRLHIIMEDSAGVCFITPREVDKMLRQKKLHPEGLLLDSLCLKTVEKTLEQNPFIENAECYKTPSGELCVSVRQRLPVLRVMAANGENYYIDDKGRDMPGAGSAAHLPVVTGHVNKDLARGVLYTLAMEIREDDFWNSQIEQINVTPKGELELVPRVGDHILFLGKPVYVKEKLKRIRTFYSKALGRIGWNRYSRISVEFDNQVICKRK